MVITERPEFLKAETVCEIPRSHGNPRNSEGDFAILRDGTVLFAYSKYTGTSNHDDAACNIAGMISTDGGNTFTELPYLLATASEHNTLNIMSVSLLRLKNGDLCLFYLCKKGAQSEYYLRRANSSDERSFGEPELCIPKKPGTYYVINNCRLCLLDNGDILIPAAKHKIVNGSGEYYGSAVIFSGDPEGKNWKELSKTFSLPQRGYSNTGLQEPGVILTKDGRLLAYFRTDRGFQYESYSCDGGKNWTTPTQSRFTSPDSPMLIAKNPYSGIYYSIWNPIPNYNGRLNSSNGRWVNAGRTPFVIAQSQDGVNFSDYTVIEDEPTHGYCYPAIHFLSKNEFLLSYCCGGPEDDMCLTKTRIKKIVIK